MTYDVTRKLWVADGEITQGARINTDDGNQNISLIPGLINNIPVKTTVYYNIPGDSRLTLARDTQYEVWYNNASDFSTIYIDPFDGANCVGQSNTSIKLVVLTSI